MEEHFVWTTTRQIKPGTLAQFERAWRPDTHPDGMLRAWPRLTALSSPWLRHGPGGRRLAAS